MVTAKLDPLGTTDIISAVLVYSTQSFMPPEILHVHAGVLITKGIATNIELRLPFFAYVLGNMADVLSAAILFTGTPPLLGEYKELIAGILLIKGLWGLFGLMQKF